MQSKHAAGRGADNQPLLWTGLRREYILFRSGGCQRVALPAQNVIRYPPMGFLDDIRERLTEKHPELQFTVRRNTLTVKAPVVNGFDVWASDAAGLVVGYDGWHEHFGADQQDEARRCFAVGFSDQVRLKVALRGRFEYKWTLECLTDGEWVEDSTTGTVPLTFWLPRRIEYRQNAVFRKGG